MEKGEDSKRKKILNGNTKMMIKIKNKITNIKIKKEKGEEVDLIKINKNLFRILHKIFKMINLVQKKIKMIKRVNKTHKIHNLYILTTIIIINI